MITLALVTILGHTSWPDHMTQVGTAMHTQITNLMWVWMPNIYHTLNLAPADPSPQDLNTYPMGIP